MRTDENKGDNTSARRRKTFKSMLRRKPREEKEWWYPYASPEEAKDLDWNDAIIEYMNRVLAESFQGQYPPELPWEGSVWIRDAWGTARKGPTGEGRIMTGQTPPRAPACMAKALAAYWRNNDLEGHRVDKWDRVMAEHIWKSMLREGKIETRHDGQFFVIPVKSDDA